MRNAAAFILGLGLVANSGSGVLAQTAYRADDIVKHFSGAPQLGATRGLCVGTEAECNPAAKPKPVEAFDLVVTFDYNSDALTPEAKQNLEEFAKALKFPSLASRSFQVDGHTDAKGTLPYNLSLSQRRANAVVRFLAERGVDTTKLVARGYGFTRPKVASNPFDPQNRRVETRLKDQ